MSVTIDLSPQAEAELAARAQAQGLGVNRYLESVLEHLLLNAVPETAFSITAFDEAFEEIARLIPPGALPLSDEAISRESIYEREDHQL